MNFKLYFKLLKETISDFSDDNASLYAASLAYYTLFSIAPLLIIAISVAGFFFGQEAAQHEIAGQIQGMVGKEGAEAIQSMIQNASKPDSGGTFATIAGVVTLLFGASGVFAQLQTALNAIWEVQPKPGQGVRSFLQSRLLSFSMVLVIGFLLLVSLVLSAVISGANTFVSKLFPGFEVLGQVLNFSLSFAMTTFLFAAIYRMLPDVRVPWKNVWIGAGVTSLLFSIGKLLIGLYLGNSGIGSTYGAAGSLVVILVWIFYSSQILLLGAEFTQVYSKFLGHPIEPSVHAVKKKNTVKSN